MEKIERTEENFMSFLAANTLINGCSYSDIFIESITREELADIIAKNEMISYKIFCNYHAKLNGACKLIILKGFINNDEYLKPIISTPIYDFDFTYAEYSLVISYLLNTNKYELLSILYNAKKIYKKIKSIKIDKSLKEKWNSFLIMYKLTN